MKTSINDLLAKVKANAQSNPYAELQNQIKDLQSRVTVLESAIKTLTKI